MTDIEDAVARERSAAVMHFQLCEAFDRGEPVAVLVQYAYTDWMRARDHLAGVAFGEFLRKVAS